METAVNDPSTAVDSDYETIHEDHGNIKPLKQRGKGSVNCKPFSVLIKLTHYSGEDETWVTVRFSLGRGSNDRDM